MYPFDRDPMVTAVNYYTQNDPVRRYAENRDDGIRDDERMDDGDDGGFREGTDIPDAFDDATYTGKDPASGPGTTGDRSGHDAPSVLRFIYRKAVATKGTLTDGMYCKLCAERLTGKATFNTHVKRHNTIRCVLCGDYHTEAGHAAHMEESHGHNRSELRRYGCRWCLSDLAHEKSNPPDCLVYRDHLISVAPCVATTRKTRGSDNGRHLKSTSEVKVDSKTGMAILTDSLDVACGGESKVLKTVTKLWPSETDVHTYYTPQ